MGPRVGRVLLHTHTAGTRRGGRGTSPPGSPAAGPSGTAGPEEPKRRGGGGPAALPAGRDGGLPLTHRWGQAVLQGSGGSPPKWRKRRERELRPGSAGRQAGREALLESEANSGRGRPGMPPPGRAVPPPRLPLTYRAPCRPGAPGPWRPGLVWGRRASGGGDFIGGGLESAPGCQAVLPARRGGERPREGGGGGARGRGPPAPPRAAAELLRPQLRGRAVRHGLERPPLGPPHAGTQLGSTPLLPQRTPANGPPVLPSPDSSAPHHPWAEGVVGTPSETRGGWICPAGWKLDLPVPSSLGLITQVSPSLPPSPAAAAQLVRSKDSQEQQGGGGRSLLHASRRGNMSPDLAGSSSGQLCKFLGAEAAVSCLDGPLSPSPPARRLTLSMGQGSGLPPPFTSLSLHAVGDRLAPQVSREQHGLASEQSEPTHMQTLQAPWGGDLAGGTRRCSGRLWVLSGSRLARGHQRLSLSRCSCQFPSRKVWLPGLQRQACPRSQQHSAGEGH